MIYLRKKRFIVISFYFFLSIFLAFKPVFSQNKAVPDDQLSKVWSFENSGIFKKDSVDVYKELNIPKTVIVENGIAKIPKGIQLQSSDDLKLDISKSQTFWSRFFIPSSVKSIEKDERINNILFQIGSLEIFYATEISNKGEYAHGVGARYTDGEKEFISNPKPIINIPVGVWFQVAVRFYENSIGNDIVKIYSRSEIPGSNSNYWVYSGQIELASINLDSSLFIGSNEKSNFSPNELWLDEFRIYNVDLDLNDLKNVWPINGEYLSVSMSNPPGAIIDYSPAYSGKFVAGSPSIVVLDNGNYLAKGDDYGPAVGVSELARIYLSEDKGKTWTQISEIEGITWASLFKHHNDLFMMGTSAGHGIGHTVIIKSEDGGYTWTHPVDSTTGLIYSDLSYHTAPVPVIKHNGKIWKAMEDEKAAGGWGKNFRAFVMNAPANENLLKSRNWTKSNILGYNKTWLGGRFTGFLEGNIAVTPEDKIANILRVSMSKGGGKAAIITYDEEGKIPSFNPDRDFIDFPGGSTKFHILFDEKTDHYWALSNAVIEKHSSEYYGENRIRNTLVLMTSDDLREWTIRETVLYHPDISKHSFQYPTFTFDGDDIIFVSRTSYDDGNGGAYNFHDANYFTFHRINDFRKYLTTDK